MTKRLLIPFAVLALVSCGDTGVSPILLLERQAEWVTHGPSSYSFTYAVQAFRYHALCPTAAWAITVRNGVAVGAICLASSQNDSTMKTTVNSIFAEAVQVEGYGNLASIEFDPTYGYPTSVVISGPPDAGSAEQAGSLTPLDPPVYLRRAAVVKKP
ncbi:MAG TPA: DUF6174 domain-containing protein [bacterium]|nr:DUF6174 domain-containing protein [bacterium]